MMKREPLDKFVQLLIPPSLVILLAVTIWELFYGQGALKGFIDAFDLYVLVIFSIDLWYRYKEVNNLQTWVHNNYLDIIATIPFNFLFVGVQGLPLLRGLRGLRFLRYSRFLRLIRVFTRSPRFLRLTKHVKKEKPRKVQPHEKQLKGTLSFKVILLITINSIMGTGIYFLTAAGAQHAGPASLVSWGILSLISLYIAACFSELVSIFPKAGGVYEYAKQAYGRFASFVIGWATAIAGSVTIAMLLLGALQYVAPNFPQYYIPAAFLLIILFNSIAYHGMKTSVVALVAFALITLFSVLSLIIPGLFQIDPSNFTPFFVFPSFAIILTIFFIAETFFGWESAVFLASETKDPTKIMPKALMIGTLVIAILSFTLAATGIGLIPWQDYAVSLAPLSDMGGALFGSAGQLIFTVLIFVSILGAVASWVVTAPRLLMAIAEDKLFFVQFAKIHPKHKSPYVSIIFQTFVLGLLVVIGAGSYTTLLHMLIPLILFIYSAVLLSVVVLRFKKPNLKRPFKVPFGKVGPILTILFMVGLLAGFIFETHGALHILKISTSLVVFGIPAYFFIELFYLPVYVTMRRNLRATIQHWMHLTYKPLPGFKKMLRLTEPKGTVVDYNSPHGAITRLLQKSLVDIETFNMSSEEVKHLKRLKLKHVKVKKIKFYALPKTKANTFYSFEDLGQVQDLDLFLTYVSKLLRKKGKFCFFVRNSLVNFHPNGVLLDDKKKVISLFKEYGLKASYLKQKRGMYTNIFIYGTNK